MSDKPLLQIRDLQIGFDTPSGLLLAVRGIDLNINEGEITALVGESGCGKSLTAMSLLNLVEAPGRITAGQILFKNEDILKMGDERLNKMRGAEASIIFQEPMTALNPVFSVGTQIGEVFITHGNYSKKEAREKAIKLLAHVGIPEPQRRVDSYPFELSGGMRQRAMIAMALAMSPSLLIADEPTTALDVTIQSQILHLIKNLSHSNQMAVLLITHDIGIVSLVADKIAIMYAGLIMEFGETRKVLSKPKHPYTKGLLNSLPSVYVQQKNKKRLEPIPGKVPELREIPEGCVFSNRCTSYDKSCDTDIPVKSSGKHYYRCVK
ncbi:MAG: ABC transporter ATP-binding protein [Spirochaetia bacterium]|nr:ABC transporter ATP-binding protein [Spirochaetia bacterium]